MTPKSKSEFYRRWLTGEFGNRVHTFMSLAELQASAYRGLVCIRYKVPNSPFCRYNVEYSDLAAAITQLTALGAEPSLMLFNEMCPDDRILLQGEMMRTPHGLELYYSTHKEPMRTALAVAPRRAYGLSANLLLNHYCEPKSFVMLSELLDKYNDAVVEFSVYSVCLGLLPGHNTIVWEVRDY